MSRRVRIVLGAAVAAATVVGLGPWLLATCLSHGRTYTDAARVPHHDVALVLGAQVYPDGTPSPYLKGRLDAAHALYTAGVVKAILVSGDNGQVHYDEPDAMRNYLISAGVPASQVVADYAGFDTYDSCVRAKRIFGASDLVVVSQSYHVPRAVATCRLVGVDAVGFGDTTQTVDARMRIYRLREVLADIKMVWDTASRRTPTLGSYETSLDAARAHR